MNFNVSKNTCLCKSRKFQFSWKNPSIKRLLQEKLLESAIFFTQRQDIRDSDDLFKRIASATIPLCRLKKSAGTVYRCALALRLANIMKLSPQAIASQLVDFLTVLNSQKSDRGIAEAMGDRPLLDFTVELVNSGWINFYLSDRALAVWLQHLPLSETLYHRGVEKEIKEKFSEMDGNVFPIQYAHARCCSLLRLAHQQGIIKLNNLDLNRSSWQWLEPNPIPWFNSDSEPRNFQLVHPAEQHLIGYLLEVVDALESPQQQDWIKLATFLSQATLDFYGSCRIWGEVNRQTPNLARARLGLIAVTQFLLRWLLREQIGILAPLEL